MGTTILNKKKGLKSFPPQLLGCLPMTTGNLDSQGPWQREWRTI